MEQNREPKILSHKCGQLYLDMGTRSIQWKGVIFTKNGAGEIEYLHAERYKLQGASHIMYINQLKVDRRLKCNI